MENLDKMGEVAKEFGLDVIKIDAEQVPHSIQKTLKQY